MSWLRRGSSAAPGTVAVLATVCAAVVALDAQRALFRAGIDEVTLNVTVTGAGGEYVNDLDMQDFQIFEDGRPQQLVHFSRAESSLTIALLLDSSSSMETQMPLVREAAVQFVATLRPGDVAQVVKFSSGVDILQDFTDDRDQLKKALGHLRTGGTTSLYNAVYIALRQLELTRPQDPAEIRRQAIVLLSDGDDTSSLLPFDEILDVAKHSSTTIYSIGLGLTPHRPSYGTIDGEVALRRLALDTGGRLFMPKEARELSDVYAHIADELANQYLLGYVSDNAQQNGAWRTVSVRLARPNMQPRTRSGYYAASQVALR